jgi:predicted amidohydrolase YtcJ
MFANDRRQTFKSRAAATEGLGPERADEIVCLGDLKRAGISFSLHSDMPMAPADRFS